MYQLEYNWPVTYIHTERYREHIGLWIWCKQLKLNSWSCLFWEVGFFSSWALLRSIKEKEQAEKTKTEENKLEETYFFTYFHLSSFFPPSFLRLDASTTKASTRRSRQKRRLRTSRALFRLLLQIDALAVLASKRDRRYKIQLHGITNRKLTASFK